MSHEDRKSLLILKAQHLHSQIVARYTDLHRKRPALPYEDAVRRQLVRPRERQLEGPRFAER